MICMADDNFSQKEIILQLINEMKELREVLADHRDLITKQSIESQSRDLKFNELKREIDEIKKVVDNLSENQQYLKFKIGMIASIAATIATVLGNKVLSILFP